MPKKFNNTSIVFRCPSNLKTRMREFAENNGQHMSAFIRSACMEVLKREASTLPPISQAQVQ